MNGSTRPDGDGRAASPIIGIILMVAIVVILAAVIGTSLVGFGQEPTKEAQAGAALEWDQGAGTGHVDVTYVTRGNSEKLEVNYEVQTNPGSNSVNVTHGSTTLTDPGTSVTLTEDPGNADEDVEVKVTVVAFLPSGEKAVVAVESETV